MKTLAFSQGCLSLIWTTSNTFFRKLDQLPKNVLHHIFKTYLSCTDLMTIIGLSKHLRATLLNSVLENVMKKEAKLWGESLSWIVFKPDDFLVRKFLPVLQGLIRNSHISKNLCKTLPVVNSVNLLTSETVRSHSILGATPLTGHYKMESCCSSNKVLDMDSHYSAGSLVVLFPGYIKVYQTIISTACPHPKMNYFYKWPSPCSRGKLMISPDASMVIVWRWAHASNEDAEVSIFDLKHFVKLILRSEEESYDFFDGRHRLSKILTRYTHLVWGADKTLIHIIGEYITMIYFKEGLLTVETEIRTGNNALGSERLKKAITTASHLVAWEMMESSDAYVELLALVGCSRGKSVGDKCAPHALQSICFDDISDSTSEIIYFPGVIKDFKTCRELAVIFLIRDEAETGVDTSVSDACNMHIREPPSKGVPAMFYVLEKSRLDPIFRYQTSFVFFPRDLQFVTKKWAINEQTLVMAWGEQNLTEVPMYWSKKKKDRRDEISHKGLNVNQLAMGSQGDFYSSYQEVLVRHTKFTQRVETQLAHYQYAGQLSGWDWDE